MNGLAPQGRRCAARPKRRAGFRRAAQRRPYGFPREQQTGKSWNICPESPKAAPSRGGGGGRDMGLYHNSERNYLAASTIFMVWTSDSHPQKVVTSPVTVGMSTRSELAMTMFWR